MEAMLLFANPSGSDSILKRVVVTEKSDHSTRGDFRLPLSLLWIPANAHHAGAIVSAHRYIFLIFGMLYHLGGQVDARNNTDQASSAEVNRVAADGTISRALSLFRASQSSGDWTMRRQAQAEWRYAIAGFNEPTLLAASKLAHDQGFYEMGILSADKTDRLLDYGLRYIAPFRDITTRYAAQANVDPAWVYGLIRQESRFMIGVRSRVGATGLMQVMPATAREIANKIGMNPTELHSIEGNIRYHTT